VLCTGIKPLSVLGIVDYIRSDQYRKAWDIEFPRLKDELREGNGQAGFVAFLQKHLVNLDSVYRETDVAGTRITAHGGGGFQAAHDAAESLALPQPAYGGVRDSARHRVRRWSAS